MIRKLIKTAQRVFWVYLTKNFIVTNVDDIKSRNPSKQCVLVPIACDNYFRVSEFRKEDRIDEYQNKMAHKELGFFTECDGKMVASIWATINKEDRSIVVRTYMRLEPNEALIHDIVTGENFRGMGVGPFMVSGIASILLNDYHVERIIIDVNARNSASLRMMDKVGLKVTGKMLCISAFGKLLLQKSLGH